MLAKFRRAHIVYALVMIAVVVLGMHYLRQHKAASPPPGQDGVAPAIEVTKQSDEQVAIHVTGAVNKPGLYRLAGSARVDDAIRLAGGTTPKADLSSVNLAAKLEDGRQILVPEKGASGQVQAGSSAGKSGAGATVNSAAGGGVTTGAQQQINLNTATSEQLQELDGVGPSTAQKIINYRKEHNGFSSVDELREVSGIGEKRLMALRDRLKV
jgi:competence protein ComEA